MLADDVVAATAIVTILRIVIVRRKLVVGNWKMNGTTAALAEAQAVAALAAKAPAVDVALCPPFTLVAAMAALCPGLAVGGQDCHGEASGAFTGSIAAAMLVDAGAQLVIVGHSERRTAWAESDAMVKAKATAALASGLRVIICVGEPLAVREQGGASAHVLAQVVGSLPDEYAALAGRIAIAYEPIWAIGTGRTAEVADIAAMHRDIRSVLGRAGEVMAILYGGSVTADNAAHILHLANVDGALVGGASLTAAKFGPIISAAG